MGKKAKLGKFRKDKFYKLAKETGYRSRAAFKLIQLNRKFGFLQKSQVCIDLCAAPGGWMQVAKQNMPISSIVIGVDLFPIRPIPGCISLVEDITTEKCKTSLTRELKTWKADVVLHDGAPNVGKNWLYDAYQQICLTLNAVKLATYLLRNGGFFVTKVFRSKDYNALLWVLKQLFKKVHATKPSASRKESAEIFIVCQGYLAPDKIDPRLLDPKYVFEELDLDDKKQQSSLLHPDKQKRIKADGYTEQNVLLRNEISVTSFMQNSNGLAALNGVSSIKMDNDSIKNHPRTTTEILECCKDIKVLGRKDIKQLLKWWKTVREDLFKTSDVNNSSEQENSLTKQKELTGDEIEDAELDELEREASKLAAEEVKDLKRKKKKVQKLRSKLNEKMNLKMVIKGDEGPREQLDDIFDLRDISTVEELEGLQDISPDIILEDQEKIDKALPKYKRYSKNNQHLDDDGLLQGSDEDSEDEVESSNSESNYDTPLNLNDNDEEIDENKKTKKSVLTKKKQEQHPLIQSSDFRDKDTKRRQRVQLWFEKEKLQDVCSDEDEDFDLDRLADEYKNKGVKILGENNENEPKEQSTDFVSNKQDKRKVKFVEEKESYSDEDVDDSSDDSDEEEVKGNISAGPKSKRTRLDERELALGVLMINSRKTKRDLIDSAWNRYAFNDEGLPTWFVQDEAQHMCKQIPVPSELSEDYENKVRELNVRPIKKVIEAKARKKKRALKRLAKAKKKAEQILENADASSQEKIRQIRTLYKKAEDKKKEIQYVVAKKHLAGKRVRRPPGVKGRFKVVDPRMKKDKRSVAAKQQKKTKGKRKS